MENYKALIQLRTMGKYCWTGFVGLTSGTAEGHSENNYLLSIQPLLQEYDYGSDYSGLLAPRAHSYTSP